eukprot:351810-Chlamydomonas_euryale.AAC.8
MSATWVRDLVAPSMHACGKHMWPTWEHAGHVRVVVGRGTGLSCLALQCTKAACLTEDTKIRTNSTLLARAAHACAWQTSYSPPPGRGTPPMEPEHQLRT